MRYAAVAICTAILALVAGGIIGRDNAMSSTIKPVFDGQRAFELLATQVDFGPRYPGSDGHASVGDWIVDELEQLGWQTDEHQFEHAGIAGRNIIAFKQPSESPLLIGAHYDTRRIADMSPGAWENEWSVPGAIDGASGVAVLLELARVIDGANVQLVFFDFEDQALVHDDVEHWTIGSTTMADSLDMTPRAVVVVDMVGQSDQQIYYEGFSDPALSREIWNTAWHLGYGDSFIPRQQHNIIDDHIPFGRLGIPSVLIIDMDYPYWHTIHDTVDKASPASLEHVGRTLEVWLHHQSQ